MCISSIIRKTFQKEKVSIFEACATKPRDRFLPTAKFATAREEQGTKAWLCPPRLSEGQTHTKLGL